MQGETPLDRSSNETILPPLCLLLVAFAALNAPLRRALVRRRVVVGDVAEPDAPFRGRRPWMGRRRRVCDLPVARPGGRRPRARPAALGARRRGVPRDGRVPRRFGRRRGHRDIHAPLRRQRPLRRRPLGARGHRDRRAGGKGLVARAFEPYRRGRLFRRRDERARPSRHGGRDGRGGRAVVRAPRPRPPGPAARVFLRTPRLARVRGAGGASMRRAR